MDKYQGLSGAEVEKVRVTYGYNQIEDKKINPIYSFAVKFWGPVPWLLELVILLTLITHRYIDTIAVAFLLLFNIIMAFVHEYRAQNAIEFLKQKISVSALTLRDAIWQTLPARELVPGDIISIKLGDIIPADIELLNGDISVDQSVITGESLPLYKKSSDKAYMGSFVVRGGAIAKVINTGKNTFFGKAAELIKIAKVKSQLEKVVFSLIQYMSIFASIIIVVLALYAFNTHIPLSEIIPMAIVMILPVIPVALPAAFTMANAIGSTLLAREGILVTSLSAIESAASMDILCTDKTGTITKNKIETAAIRPYYDYTENDIIYFAKMASEDISEDLLEKAIINYHHKNNIDDNKYNYTKVGFEVFDPDTKMSKAVLKAGEAEIHVIKGSPLTVITPRSKQENSLYDDIENLSRKGLRTIAIAIDVDNFRQIIGLIGFADPLRDDSKKLVEDIKNMGVKVVMLTGDGPTTAQQIAIEAGIDGKICTKQDIQNNINQCGIFAGIYPEDKFNIVRSLQKDHVVGMTGDGVNDAPALKQSNFGIAVANATDVAKSSAGVVLTNEGLINILSAIKVSRQIYQRMLTYVFNKTIKAFDTVITIFISFFILKFFIMTPHLIIMKLIFNDFVTLSITTDNTNYSQKPDKWEIKKIALAAIGLSILTITTCLFLIFFYGIHIFQLNHDQIRTFAFFIIVNVGQLSLIIIRERKSILLAKIPSTWLLFSIILTIVSTSVMAATGIFMYPVGWKIIVVTLITLVGIGILYELYKLILFRLLNIE